MGRAQTEGNFGVVDHRKEWECIVDDGWKAAPQEVKVPYTKCMPVGGDTRVMPSTWNSA